MANHVSLHSPVCKNSNTNGLCGHCFCILNNREDFKLSPLMKASAAVTQWTEIKLKWLFYVGISNVDDYMEHCADLKLRNEQAFGKVRVWVSQTPQNWLHSLVWWTFIHFIPSHLVYAVVLVCTGQLPSAFSTRWQSVPTLPGCCLQVVVGEANWRSFFMLTLKCDICLGVFCGYNMIQAQECNTNMPMFRFRSYLVILSQYQSTVRATG